MSYPFVQSANDYGVRKGPVLGITWHMAEGGGTVGYLSKPNPNGVSVHFVVEYSGRIVQMLRLDHANGSINPADIRTDDDPPYLWAGEPVVYGASAAKVVLDKWWQDPNSATIGVEVEGFATDGPNGAQANSMAALWVDLAGSYSVRSLAHRDFADYKPCPGRHIPWERLGGHGPSEESMSIYIWRAQPGTFTIPAGQAVKVYRPDADGFEVAKTRPPASTVSRAVAYDAHLGRISGTGPSSLLHVPPGDAYFGDLYVSTAEVDETDTPPDDTAQYNAGVDAAVAAAGTARKS